MPESRRRTGNAPSGGSCFLCCNVSRLCEREPELRQTRSLGKEGYLGKSRDPRERCSRLQSPGGSRSNRSRDFFQHVLGADGLRQLHAQQRLCQKLEEAAAEADALAPGKPRVPPCTGLLLFNSHPLTQTAPRCRTAREQLHVIVEPGLWPSLQLFQLKGGEILNAGYLSFINAAASSRTSGFTKNVLSRGIMFTCTPSASSSAATIG
jgi:hypothetical protein